MRLRAEQQSPLQLRGQSKQDVDAGVSAPKWGLFLIFPKQNSTHYSWSLDSLSILKPMELIWGVCASQLK